MKNLMRRHSNIGVMKVWEYQDILFYSKTNVHRIFRNVMLVKFTSLFISKSCRYLPMKGGGAQYITTLKSLGENLGIPYSNL
jgi:hypothetical protein